MVSVPKTWKFKEVWPNNGEVDKVVINGGYYTHKMRKLINKGSLIRQNSKNKDKSMVDEKQINCINYLNKQKYRINKEILSFLLNE